jgi:hypothetical protein
MKHYYSKAVFIALTLFGFKANAQCSSCTGTITGVDPANYVIGAGTTLCITSTGTATGLITVGAGGTLCVEGTINSTNLWVAGGTLINHGTISTDKILTSGQGNFYNYGSITMDSLLVTNIYSTLSNSGSISGIRLGNSDYSNITNTGNITVDYMGDSAASFTNDAAGSIIVNYDFANAYNSGFFNNGYFKVMRDFYNSTGSTVEVTCMAIVGRDWYNTAVILGPNSSCGGFNIAGGSYNTGSIGSASAYIDICDAGNPTFGLDGPGGTIATTTTYCACSNNCVQVISGISPVESSDVITALYPNPAVTSISLMVNSGRSETLTIEIYDMMGKKQMNKTINANSGENKLELDITELSQGTYIVNVIDGHQLQSKQLFNVLK